MTTPITECVSCGTAVTGAFCPQCGAATGPRSCVRCSAPLSPGAGFCHRCGAAAGAAAATSGAPRERMALGIGAAAILIAVATVAYLLGRGASPATVPDMANAGNAGAGAAEVAGRAPDISSMTPRERFDRLFDRVVRAAEAQKADTVMLFAPMAIQAYQMLDQADADARYHAAMIHLVVGDFPGALALADTILIARPTHLFGFVIRGEVAEQQNDGGALARAYADFRNAYDGEMKAGLQEYSEHQPVLTDFRNRADANKR
ncbi:MAG: zinc ribbon domain-containing protein [Gemmatimonadales bacterium]